MDTPILRKFNREFSNFLIAPNRQLRLALMAVLFGLLFLFAVFGFQMWIFTSLVGSLSASLSENPALIQIVSESVRWAWRMFFIACAFFTTMALALTIVFSHRIYGPAFAIRKHLAAISNGDFAFRTTLRKHDELKDIANDLNSLSERLEQGESAN